MKIIYAIAVLILLLVPISFAQIPKLNAYVNDKSDVITPEIEALLEQDLRNLEKDTNGMQFVIYTEPSYPKSYSLEEYTLKIAEENGIGKKSKDNGVLLYVATQDREYRWEIGYGAESVLSASVLGRVSRDYLLPAFKQDDFERGIVESADVVARLALDSNDPDIVALRETAQSTNSKVWIYILIFVGVIILISFINYKATKGQSKGLNSDFYRGAGTGLFLGSLGRGRGGGGFGGSGFGGFSGGGGGFGGGGFSGKF